MAASECKTAFFRLKSIIEKVRDVRSSETIVYEKSPRKTADKLRCTNVYFFRMFFGARFAAAVVQRARTPLLYVCAPRWETDKICETRFSQRTLPIEKHTVGFNAVKANAFPQYRHNVKLYIHIYTG